MPDDSDRRKRDEGTMRQFERIAAARVAARSRRLSVDHRQPEHAPAQHKITSYESVSTNTPPSTVASSSAHRSTTYSTASDTASNTGRTNAGASARRDVIRDRMIGDPWIERVPRAGPTHNDPRVYSEADSHFGDIQQYNGGTGHPSPSNVSSEDLLSDTPSIFGGAREIQSHHGSTAYATYDATYNRQPQYAQAPSGGQYLLTPPPSASSQRSDRLAYSSSNAQSRTSPLLTRSQPNDRRPSGPVQPALSPYAQYLTSQPSPVDQRDHRRQP